MKNDIRRALRREGRVWLAALLVGGLLFLIL
jgi:hypothetical protein